MSARGNGLLAALLLSSAACTPSRPEADGGAAVSSRAPSEEHPRRNEVVGGDVDAGDPPPSTLTLLDPGRPPRAPLRYGWRVDQPEELTMDLRTVAIAPSGDAQAPATPLPPVHIVIAIAPEDVSPEGDLRYGWRVTHATVGATSATPDAIADGMRSDVFALEGLSGRAVVDSRGLARHVSVDRAAPAGMGGPSQMVEQVLQTLRDLAAPFPDEPVGPGARWRKTGRLSARQAEITQTETFALVELGEERGRLRDELAQTGPSQILEGAGLPDGAQARLESMLLAAHATMLFDRTRLVPQTRVESTTTMVVSGHGPGNGTRRVPMVLRVEIVIAGAKR